MTKPARRRLLWIGAVLILLPTILLIVTFFQPREYQSSVFIEVARPGMIRHSPPVDRDTLYLILFIIGIYLPGLVLTLTALLARSSQSSASGPPHI